MDKNKYLCEELKKIARNSDIHFRAILNINGGRGWINYSQIEDNDYKVQVSIGGKFDTYRQIREDIKKVFEQVDAVLAEEKDYGNRQIGFQKELIFMDKAKHDNHIIPNWCQAYTDAQGKTSLPKQTDFLIQSSHSEFISEARREAIARFFIQEVRHGLDQVFAVGCSIGRSVQHLGSSDA